MHICVDKINPMQRIFQRGHDSVPKMWRFTHEECAGSVKYRVLTIPVTYAMKLSDQNDHSEPIVVLNVLSGTTGHSRITVKILIQKCIIRILHV
jgi:hypothetical protein